MFPSLGIRREGDERSDLEREGEEEFCWREGEKEFFWREEEEGRKEGEKVCGQWQLRWWWWWWFTEGTGTGEFKSRERVRVSEDEMTTTMKISSVEASKRATPSDDDGFRHHGDSTEISPEEGGLGAGKGKDGSSRERRVYIWFNGRGERT